MRTMLFCSLVCLALACDDDGAGTPTQEGEDAATDASRVLGDAAVPDAGCVPSEELCNGVDDNCDGNIDEGFDGLGGACMNEASPCLSAGTWVCAEDGQGTVCDAPIVMPDEELCDGADNDCDGRADEDFDFASDVGHCGGCGRACDFENATAACFDGTCEMIACDNGFGDANMVPVDGCECPVDPAGESCNEVDDDCDGTTDEGLGFGEACTVGVGACATAGTNVCADGGVACDATAGEPSPEVCDGVDNDCDGSVDEDFDGDGDGAGFCPELDCLNCPQDEPCWALCEIQDCRDDDPAIFPGARDICEDGIDQDCTGADSSCDGPTGRVNAISIAAAGGAGCRDFNGDGNADNSLALAAIIANGEIANAIQGGQLNLFTVALGRSGDRFDLGVLVADQVGRDYTLDPSSLDEDNSPRMLFPGARVAAGGEFSAGPGQFVLDVPFNGVELDFVVDDTMVTGTVEWIGDDGMAIQGGWITGFVTDEQVQRLLLLVPDFADIIQMFLNADVDTDGDDVPDAYSACLEYTAVSQALLGFPPEAPEE